MSKLNSYYGDVFLTARIRYRMGCETPDCKPETILRTINNAEYEWDVTDDELLEVLEIDSVRLTKE